MPLGLLAAGFDFAPAAADEFHDWYDLEHLPERQRVPGFGLSERWIGRDAPAHALAIYDLDDLAVLASPPYKAIAYENLSVWSKRVTSKCRRLLRFEGEQITPPGTVRAPVGAGGVLINAMNIAQENEKDFNAWYDEEHIPALAAVPGVMAARRYRSDGSPKSTHKYVALYHLSSPDVPLGAAWKSAIDTPWSARMTPLFRDRVRILTRRYVRGQV